MIDVLPLKFLRDEDASIFGALNVKLAKLQGFNIPIAQGVVVSAPALKLKIALEHFDYGSHEIIEQSLTLVKKEIRKIPVPDILIKEIGKHNEFLVGGEQIKGVRELWFALLDIWVFEIKNEIWKSGFYPGLTEKLEPQVVTFIGKIEAFGEAFYDYNLEDFVVNIKKGKVHPADLKKIDLVVTEAHKRLLLPFCYEWVLDGGVKISKVKAFIPRGVQSVSAVTKIDEEERIGLSREKVKSAVKVFGEMSVGLRVEKDLDGIFIDSSKIFDLNKSSNSFDELTFKIVDLATNFPSNPVLVKLADKSEGMGKVRGSLRLLHQESLLNPLCESINFARQKKNLQNVHVVVPFVRGAKEFLQIKRELAVRKVLRKNNLEIWLEIATPENILNLEDYLVAGVDGVVLNLDELLAHLNGFDPNISELSYYKNEVTGLFKFLEDGLRLLHKSKVKFLAYGSNVIDNKILEYLVEKGVFGLITQRYELQPAEELLRLVEKRLVLKRAA